MSVAKATPRKKYQDWYGEALDYVEDANSWNGDFLISGLLAVMASAVNPLFAPAFLLWGGTRIVGKIERKVQLEQEILEMEMGYKPRALVPYLPPAKQKEYLKSVGQAAYQQERDRAIAQGLGVPPLPAEAEAAALPPAETEEEPQDPQALGVAFEFTGDLIKTLSEQIHLLISATTGSGKSTILKALAHHVIQRGDAVTITDPKMESWGDLQEFVFWPESASDITSVIKAMEEDFRRRQGPDKPRAHSWWIFDEWFLVRALASTLSKAELTALEQRLIKVIAAGRSLGIHLVIVNQSHYLGDLSLSSGKNTFSTGLRSNIATLGLGAEWTLGSNKERIAAKYDSIELMLSDGALLPNSEAREQGRKFFSELRRRPEVNRAFMLATGSVFIHPTPDLSVTETPPTPRIPQPTATVEVVAQEVPEAVDWPTVVPQLLAQHGGLRRAMANVFKSESLVEGGPRWQELRDSLRSAVPTLDPALVAQLRAKWPNVDVFRG